MEPTWLGHPDWVLPPQDLKPQVMDSLGPTPSGGRRGRSIPATRAPALRPAAPPVRVTLRNLGSSEPQADTGTSAGEQTVCERLSLFPGDRGCAKGSTSLSIPLGSEASTEAPVSSRGVRPRSMLGAGGAQCPNLAQGGGLLLEGHVPAGAHALPTGRVWAWGRGRELSPATGPGSVSGS